MTKPSKDWGEERPDGSPAMRELWARARAMDAERPVPGGRWLPWRAVEVDDALLPRERIDEGTVARYRECFADLPPIRVERGRLRLIGGRHRLAAAVEVSDIVPAIEADVEDDQHLRELAYLDNATHGREYTQTERVKMARFLLMRHHPNGLEQSKWPVARIAALSGVARATIFRWLAEEKDARAGDSPTAGTSVAMRRLPPQEDRLSSDDVPAARTSRDGSPALVAPRPAASASRNAPLRNGVTPSRGDDERWGAVLAGMEAVVELLSEMDVEDLPDDVLDDQITRAEAWAVMGERVQQAANETHLRLLNVKAARESERLAVAQREG